MGLNLHNKARNQTTEVSEMVDETTNKEIFLIQLLMNFWEYNNDLPRVLELADLAA